MEVTVEQLHEWAARQAGGDDKAAAELLAEITLEPTKREWNYWCDPPEVGVFAATGIDGAHFGQFVAEDGTWPVVLIAPECAENCWTIVGQSLDEFLCLGCQVGYGLLVELATQPAETVRRIEEPEATTPRQQEILESLRQEFSLEPWKDVGRRLFELQELYLDELILPD